MVCVYVSEVSCIFWEEQDVEVRMAMPWMMDQQGGLIKLEVHKKPGKEEVKDGFGLGDYQNNRMTHTWGLLRQITGPLLSSEEANLASNYA